jgi:hypothetical protein
VSDGTYPSNETLVPGWTGRRVDMKGKTMRSKKALIGLGLTGMLAGTVWITAAPALAEPPANELITTYWSSDLGTSESACQYNAGKYNVPGSSFYYYCGGDHPERVNNGQHEWGTNLWRSIRA